jgi:transcription elongation factor SPT5
MSSSEEDVDYTPNKDLSEDGSEISDSQNEDSQVSEGSESEAEFTDEEVNSKSKSKKRSKSAKPAKKKTEKRSRFLDTEALVGDETDDDDEEDAEFLEDFIAGSDEEEEAAAAAAELRESRPRRPVKGDEDLFDAEAEEQRLKALYGRNRELSKTSSSITSTVPRPFLLPTVTDPKLWLCKAQQGRERSSALALLRVIMERQYSGNPLQIFSIIARDGLKGYVYIEAHKPIHIAQAIEIAKLNHCLYPGQAGKSLVLVPLAEMPQVLQTTAASGSSGSAAASAEIPDIGAWVRVKRGRYANDLAQVVDNAQDEGSYDPTNLNTCNIRVKLLPRLNFTSSSSANSKDRAPPRLFDPEEASRYGPVSKSRGFWIFGGETYRDGFLFKNIRLSSLVTGSVSPTPEELARFPDSDRPASDNYSGTPESIGTHDISLSPGDQVIVLEGEMKNLQASVDSLEWRPNPSTGRPEQFAHLLADASTGLQGESARFTIKVSQLRKIFAVGAQVRIISGPHANEIGIVVAIDSGTKNVVVFASGSNQQFSVPAGICALAQANSSGNGMEAVKSTSMTQSRNVARSNDYSLDDLVQFEVEVGGEEGVGVVIRILDAENSVAVFDSLGQIRNIPCRSVGLVANYNESSVGSYAFSASGDSNLKQGDRVIEKNNGAFYKILHIYKSLAFVRPLSGAIPSGSAAIAVLPLDNVSKPRPVPAFRLPGTSVTNGPSPAGQMIGKSVTITGGPQKGYVGFVKQISDNLARVELHTNGKIISVSVDKLALVSGGKSKDSRDSRDGRDSRGDSTARTPAWNSSSAKTPAWNASGGKTPGWNSSSSKTPGWNSSSSRTPGWNPATSTSGSSSRTPAWNAASSARTPAWNPSTTPSHSHSSTSGAKTPAWSTSTGMTPAWNVPTAVGQSSTAASWQKGTTPAWNSSSSRTPAWSRPDDSEQQNDNNKEKQPWDQVNHSNWKKD